NINLNSGSTISTGSGYMYIYADMDSNGGSVNRAADSGLISSGYVGFQSSSSISTSTFLTPFDTLTGSFSIGCRGNYDLTVDSDIGRVNQSVSLSGRNVTQQTGADIMTGTGSVFLSAGGASGTGAFTQAAGAVISGGSISINTRGSGSLLSVTANGAGNDINIGGFSGSGTLTVGSLTAADDISFSDTGNFMIIDDGNAGTVLTGDLVTFNAVSIGSAANNISTDAFTVALTTSNGSAYIREQNNLNINASTITNGSAYISSGVPVNLAGMLTATGAGTNTVNLTTRSGDYNIVALANVNGQEGFGFAAEGGNVVVMGAINTTNRNLTLTGNAVTISNTVTTGTADFTATANTGAIALNSLITAKNITLTSTAGNLLDGNAAANNIVSTGTCNFTAGGYIGTAADPIEVTINPGSLSIAAQGQSAGVSAAINGTILPANTYTYNADAPGSILFNAAVLNQQAVAPVPINISLSEKDRALRCLLTDKKDPQAGVLSNTDAGVYLPLAVDFSSYTLPNPYNFHISPYLVLPGESRTGR
ncbi:MAG: hypothetical protein WC547_10380, partial [Candidatus Omnitrophota bacterium]